MFSYLIKHYYKQAFDAADSLAGMLVEVAMHLTGSSVLAVEGLDAIDLTLMMDAADDS